jgi:hypothetical protein
MLTWRYSVDEKHRWHWFADMPGGWVAMVSDAAPGKPGKNYDAFAFDARSVMAAKGVGGKIVLAGSFEWLADAKKAAAKMARGQVTA